MMMKQSVNNRKSTTAPSGIMYIHPDARRFDETEKYTQLKQPVIGGKRQHRSAHDFARIAASGLYKHYQSEPQELCLFLSKTSSAASKGGRPSAGPNTKWCAT